MLIDRLNWRYATKKMDPAKVVPTEKVEAILEAVRLAPTSSGLQPFEVIVVTDPAVREELKAAAYDQAQLVDGSHVLVFAAWDDYTDARIDMVLEEVAAARGGLTENLTAYYDRLRAGYVGRDAEVNFQHAARQAYIGLGMALTAASFEEVDSTPMEGFDPEVFDEILGLRARGLRSVAVMPLGYRAAEGDWLQGQTKVRRATEKFITRVDAA